MKLKIFLLSLVLVFIFLSSFSQVNFMYYFDGNLNSCARTAAKFTGYGTSLAVNKGCTYYARRVLAKMAVNAIVKVPRWNPALQYGKAVNAYREQPITFTIQ